jgi:hypothetical protein
MGTAIRKVAGWQISRLGEKNLTRHWTPKLRSFPSCRTTGTRFSSSLIHGATDANGR